MATLQRIFSVGECYHVYNRGVNKMTIFHSKQDFERFLKTVERYKQQFPIKIIAWALMPNHFHLVLQEPVSLFAEDNPAGLTYAAQENKSPASVSGSLRNPRGLSSETANPQGFDESKSLIQQFMHRVTTAYAKYYQIKYADKHSGAVFQGRFKAKHVDSDAYLMQLIHYCHKQAEHHQIASCYDWEYSSLHEYLYFGTSLLKYVDFEESLIDIKTYPEQFQLAKDLEDEEFE